MSLIELKQYLMRVRLTSLASLCLHFKTDAGVIRQMLGHWIKKGCVKQCMRTPACGVKCGKCDLPTVEIYEWV